jgi:hypothetical protein
MYLTWQSSQWESDRQKKRSGKKREEGREGGRGYWGQGRVGAVRGRAGGREGRRDGGREGGDVQGGKRAGTDDILLCCSRALFASGPGEVSWFDKVKGAQEVREGGREGGKEGMRVFWRSQGPTRLE